ncbi:MAG: PQQ-binding-like beta-propeller repeat protein [Sphingomonas sp.]|uniref:outer membrane protein assembly factor BamB family protein n=1 Tax=Sphingomonas sp. TaxID=28214 RepID=UPI001AC8689C|nr:PQQ-binding-like beta-propeller repeat protein [Sphingomonas sp.]MBN8814428.1 PQQ-binding-like beta-propeller repeat protein [Sphingomonas sp.]
MTSKWRIATAALALTALAGCGVFKGGGKKTPTVGERIPILVSESDAKLDPSIAGLQVLLPAPAVNGDWAQPGGNASKSMGHLALGGTVSRAWTASMVSGSSRERLASAPVISGGKLYVVDIAAMLHAYDAASGASLWTVPVAKGDENKPARFGGGASVDGGRVYATDGLGDVVAFDANTGAEVWRVKPGGPLRGAPTIDGDQLYVLSQDNQLFALSTTDGSQKWNSSGSLETQGVFGVAAPAAARSTIVAGFSSGELNAYRYENGRTLWGDALSRTSITTSVSSLSDIDADPVIDGNQVYALGQGGRMIAADLASGQRIWEQNFAGISTPWLAGEWIFVVTDESKLYCLQRSTGKVRWVSQLRAFKVEKKKKKKGPLTWYGPVLAGNRLVLTNSLGEVTFVSPTDGAIGQVIDNKESFGLGPVVANNMLYTLDTKGRITAYR